MAALLAGNVLTDWLACPPREINRPGTGHAAPQQGIAITLKAG
tara:strand:- start:472 stop:600 length:129 start_codon:yes stop_codon:yes gene_type:complete